MELLINRPPASHSSVPRPLPASTNGTPGPLNSLQQSRLLARIAAITCSSAWTSALFVIADNARLDPTTTNVPKALRDRGIYPPSADPGQHDLPRKHPVRMRRCDACGRIVPPNNLAERKLVRVCDDCRIEPDLDPDLDRQQLEKAACARTPGVRFRLLVEGAVAGLTPRQAARRQLTDFGLTEQEITVLAYLIEGYSTRRIAGFIERSQTFVLKVQRSAERKVRRSGLATGSLGFLTKHLPKQRERIVDPQKLEAVAHWNA